MKKPQVSIITPCYNDGKYLMDAVESTRSVVESGFCEHIIVDDGSDDPETLALYEKLESSHVKIIFAGKVGLGKARNIGIAASKCDYYLNLDADNRIHQDYPAKGAAILEKYAEVGVVYSDLRYFGAATNDLSVGGFEVFKLLNENYVDSCTVIRKKTWKDAGGYDEKEMLWEDWNFWLGVLHTHWKFHYINEVLFDYRVRLEGSLRTTSQVRGDSVKKYLAFRYGPLYMEKYQELFKKYEELVNKSTSLEAENIHLKNELKGIEKSISWRITTPCRKLMSKLKNDSKK